MRCCVKKPHEITKTTFGVPKDKMLQVKWEAALGMRLNKSNRVCSHHFKVSDIISTWTSGQGASKYTITLKRSTLKKGSIPFLNCGTLKKVTEPDIDSKIEQPEYETLFQSVYTDLELVNLSLPRNWFNKIEYLNKEIIICFYKLNAIKDDYTRYIEKQLLITNDSKIILHINGKTIKSIELALNLHNIKNKEELLIVLQKLNDIKCCQGAVSSTQYTDIKDSFGEQYIELYGKWRHEKCSTVLNITENDICLWCKRLTYIIKKKGKWLQSHNSSIIHDLINKKEEIQKPKRVVKKKLQANKEDNVPAIVISDLKEQYDTSEIKEYLRKVKIDKVVVKDHNYCLSNNSELKKINIKWIKSNPPKGMKNAKCILFNIPK